MKLQVLVSTMNQKDYSLVQKMNIQSDAIFVNQCDRYGFEDFEYNGNSIQYFSFSERGVGLSRNNGLMRSTADICLFADEDVTYIDNYYEIVLKAFGENPKADVILFNVPSKNPDRPAHLTKKNSRVRWYNCLKYGAVRIAVKSDSLKQANIYFSLLFGGGAKYSAGEDSLFVSECVKKKLKVYAVPSIIGYVSQEDSSWFEGYTDRYFYDKGVFYYCLSKKWAKILCLQFIIRHSKMFKHEKTLKEAFMLMSKGIRDVKRVKR
ncbi:glycosyltransferase family A protein [Bacillus sp. E214]|uniref:glycosyltransferase family A protein n=1 Tax=Bacillus sp. E214 TaxID=2587156 RepID=UPI0011DF3540|nr:glycosyltransferase [Bacillus sp. E214]